MISHLAPTFPREQLAKYVSHVYECAPEHGDSELKEIENSIQRDPLKALKSIQQRHLAAIPFGNVALHYSQHRIISLDPDVLFHKLVERGMGGYCVENSGLFAIVLRSLGFTIYTGAARVNKGIDDESRTGEYFGWSHMVIIVTVGDNKYLVDVGFGPKGPTGPMLLESGETSKTIAPEGARLIRSNISMNTDSAQRLWLYQFRTDTTKNEWMTAYAFPELEFSREDYEVMNFFTSQHPTSTFVRGFIVAKFLLNEAKDDIIGWLMLAKNTVKRNVNGEVETLQTLQVESERVDALAKLFNIHLQPMEVRGIQSMGSELK